MFNYRHEQKAPLHWILYAVALVLFVIGVALQGDASLTVALCVAALVIVFLALMSTNLTVTGQDEHVTIVYGLLPLLRFKIKFDDIRAVEIVQTSILDGLVVSWLPFRGWTYRLWGNDCVKVKVKRRTVRIGTDDPERLARFLGSKIRESAVDRDKNQSEMSLAEV